MNFPNKEATLVAIKQYHITKGFKFVVVESKTDRYVARCIDYNNGCQWRLRASFSKIRDTWEIKKIEAPHTCLSTTLSDDHVNLDSNQIAIVVVNSIKANSFIPVKSLITKIKSGYGYSVTYKKKHGWQNKRRLPWNSAIGTNPIIISQDGCRRFKKVSLRQLSNITRPFVIGDVQDNSCNIFERVFWAFKPCIDGFNYCKSIVQVDGTFLTGKYHGTLLTAIGQDGNRKIFLLAFTIVEGEIKETLIWFFLRLRSHVMPKQNICMITDRGKAILSALKSPEVAWEGHGLLSIYCIRHIASNFNKKFKNAEAKRQLINMGIYLNLIHLY